MRGVVGLILLLGILPLSGASRQTAPQAIPRFKAGVELVVLDVSALDKDRQPVRGLKAEDFTVLEDGKPQEIATFSAVDLPDVFTQRTVTAPWVQAVAPDVQRNTDVKDRRLVLIVMDDATPMPIQEVPRARAIARQMIEALGPSDLACVVYTSYRRSGQEFTRDRDRLVAAVDRFNGAISPVWGLDMYGNFRNMFFDEIDVAATTRYEGTLSVIKGLADDLAALPERRKALVLVSVGIPLEIPNLEIPNTGDMGSAGAGSTDAIRQLWQSLQTSLDAARRSNVAVYALDPGGLRAPGGVAAADSFRPGRPNQDFLKTVSENTGGFVITDTNAPAPQIQQLLRENSSYYLIGYAPLNTRAEGRYRKIEVKVKRPDVTVRTRKGYFEAEPARAKNATRSTSNVSGSGLGILPKTDLPMSLTIAPFALQRERNAALAIVVRIERPAPEQAGQLDEEVHVHVAAYAPSGERRGQVNRVFPISIKTSGTGGTIRFDMPLRLDLPPGRYHVRVGAERKPRNGASDDTAAGAEGSVYADVDVPDFAKEPLTLSGVVLTTPRSPGSASLETLASVLPAMPTMTRAFAQADQVTAFLRVYQQSDRAAAEVVVKKRLLDVRGNAAFESSETLSEARFGTTHSAEVKFDLPLASLPPEPYLLTIEASTSTGKVSVKREVRLEVKGQ